MHVTVSIMGMPEHTPGPQELGLENATVADVWSEVTENDPEGAASAEALMAFVNGRAVQEQWDDIELTDGDEVLFMVPISGG